MSNYGRYGYAAGRSGGTGSEGYNTSSRYSSTPPYSSAPSSSTTSSSDMYVPGHTRFLPYSRDGSAAIGFAPASGNRSYEDDPNVDGSDYSRYAEQLRTPDPFIGECKAARTTYDCGHTSKVQIDREATCWRCTRLGRVCLPFYPIIDVRAETKCIDCSTKEGAGYRYGGSGPGGPNFTGIPKGSGNHGSSSGALGSYTGFGADRY